MCKAPATEYGSDNASNEGGGYNAEGEADYRKPYEAEDLVQAKFLADWLPHEYMAYRRAYRALRVHEQAEDVVAGVRLKLWRHYKKTGELGDDPVLYISRSITNAILDAVKDREEREANEESIYLKDADSGEEYLVEVADGDADTEESGIREAYQPVLSAQERFIKAGLSPRENLILYLATKEVTAREAVALGVSRTVGGYRVALSKTRVKAQGLLEEWQEQEEMHRTESYTA